MNTPNTPSDAALLRANLLGFVTHIKAASACTGKPVADAEVIGMHKRATSYLQTKQASLNKLRETILTHIKGASSAAPAPAAA